MYPFVSWAEAPYIEALKLMDYTTMTVLYENALFFEVWQGAISHSEAMAMTPKMRSSYAALARFVARKRQGKTGAEQSDIEED